VHGANEKSLEGGEWNAITEHGTFALAAWCERWGLAGAKFLGLPGREPADDGDDKDEAPDDDPDVDDDFKRTLDRRLDLMGLLARRLLNESLPDPSRRLLLYLMSHLRHSPHPDIAIVSRRFLPVDVGVTAEEVTAAYRILYEQEFIDRVDALTAQSRRRPRFALAGRRLQ
jgi:hypothetical protein